MIVVACRRVIVPIRPWDVAVHTRHLEVCSSSLSHKPPTLSLLAFDSFHPKNPLVRSYFRFVRTRLQILEHMTTLIQLLRHLYQNPHILWLIWLIDVCSLKLVLWLRVCPHFIQNHLRENCLGRNFESRSRWLLIWAEVTLLISVSIKLTVVCILYYSISHTPCIYYILLLEIFWVEWRVVGCMYM